MIKTIPSSHDNSGDEFNLVARFSNETVEHIASIQNKLQTVLGDAIWLTPQSALHSTIMEIICNVDYGPVPRRRIYADWAAVYSNRLGNTLHGTQRFTITFDQLVASQNAIILKASDAQPYSLLRGQLLRSITLPEHTKRPPDIAHCSIARYNRVIDLHHITSAIDHINVCLHVDITQLCTASGLGPPSYSPTIVETYNLHP